MPHILLSKHDCISTPSNIDGVEFISISKDFYEEKIQVKTKEKEFFLTKLKKDGNSLIKLDQATRVTPIDIAKSALNAYAKISKANILFTNAVNNENKLKPEDEYLKEINYFVNDFQTQKKICVEVGFGSGRHLIYQALKNPDTIYIGLEIHTPSIEQMLKQVRLQNVTNILAINYDARLFLEFLKSNTVSQIFVHFPVPWDKKPHRRVMSDEFIIESLRVLKINGSLELRTDSPNYFEYAQELVEHFPNNKNTIFKDQDLAVTSKYEDRWKKQGKSIWDITFFANEISADIIIDKDFSFNIKNTIDLKKIEKNIDKNSIVKKDFFLHIEHMYFSNDVNAFILLTMGSFNKPLSIFIQLKDQTISYFQNNPIPTSSNHNAHILLQEVINESLV